MNKKIYLSSSSTFFTMVTGHLNRGIMIATQSLQHVSWIRNVKEVRLGLHLVTLSQLHEWVLMASLCPAIANQWHRL